MSFHHLGLTSTEVISHNLSMLVHSKQYSCRAKF